MKASVVIAAKMAAVHPGGGGAGLLRPPKPNQKTHYSFVNFGDGTTVAEIFIWLGKNRQGRAIMSGKRKFP